jgi:hypothetical protein
VCSLSPNFRREVGGSTSSSNKLKQGPQLRTPSHLGQNSLLARQADGKLEFETFLKALELIAAKLYPEAPLESSIEAIVVENLLKLLSVTDYEKKVVGLHQIAKVKEILSHDENVRMMGIVIENVEVYFDHYSDTKNHMNFNNFVRFFKDFDIFPRFVSKGKLSNYFYTLASLNVR